MLYVKYISIKLRKNWDFLGKKAGDIWNFLEVFLSACLKGFQTTLQSTVLGSEEIQIMCTTPELDSKACNCMQVAKGKGSEHVPKCF